jgi:hypothetical protein
MVQTTGQHARIAALSIAYGFDPAITRGPYKRGNTELPLTAAWTSAHAPKLPWTVGRRIGRAGGHRTLNRSMPEEKAQGVSGML